MSSRCLFAAVVLMALAGPSLAEAQLPNQGLELTAADIDTSNPGGKLYVNVKACSGNTTMMNFKVTFTSSAGVMQVPFLEVWGGTGGNDCSQKEKREVPSGGGNTTCWLVYRSTSAVTTGTETSANFAAGTAFGNHTDDCAKATGAAYDLYFLPLDSQTTEGTSDAPPVKPMVMELKGTFTLYTNVPTKPGGLSGRDGESQIGASWDVVNAGKDTEYDLYFDSGSGGMADEDGEQVACGSGKLAVDKAPPAADGKTIWKVDEKSTSGNLTDLDSKGIEIGDKVAVAVATQDVAGNISLLSAPVCVERVSTTGFWDACSADSSCKDDFDSCSASPGHGAGGALGALALAACCLVLGRRRRLSGGRNV